MRATESDNGCVPLDPPIQQMLTTLEAMGGESLASGSPEHARQGFRSLTVDFRNPESVPPVAAVKEVELPGPAGGLRARVYRPEVTGPLPTILFIHGGGFVIGDLDTHDNQCRALCGGVEAVVLSLEYRLAPEAPYPAAVEDCFAALEWVGAHLDQLGGDRDRLVVAGDSAGGNLAAVSAVMARASRRSAARGTAADLSRHRFPRGRGPVPLTRGECRGLLPDTGGHGVVRRALRRPSRLGGPASLTGADGGSQRTYRQRSW